MWTNDQTTDPVESSPTPDQSPGQTGQRPPSRLAAVRRLWAWAQQISDVVTPTNLVFGLIALGLVLVGAFGGWSHVRAVEEELPVVATGSELSASPFKLTVTKSWYADEVPKLLRKTPGQRYLLVVGKVTSEHPDPVLPVIFQEALRIDVPGCVPGGMVTVPGVCHPERILREDSLDMPSLQPGMEQLFVAVFRQDSASPTPSQMTVIASSQVWRASNLDGGMGWRDITPAATVTVPTKKLAS
ncbi:MULTISPECIES: hypothetical protein [unclassified Luteococcus]|uniref:hypothetical protein n=1 Tax=unclassified Luteococcus TaxID=2639923 RepID=UPI00313F0F1C